MKWFSTSETVRFLQGLLLVAFFTGNVCVAAPTAEEVFASAKEKGKLVADDYFSRNIYPNASGFNYFDACSYYGACRYGEAINDTNYIKSIYNKYVQHKPSSIPTGDVDKNSSGLLPLYLFTIYKDSSLLKLGKAAADASLQAKGYPRYAIDDTYMTGALMVQAYRATGDTAYINFCARYLATYFDTLQQSNGLYWHKLDSKNFWGRGNGWGCSSATELLLELDTSNPQYEHILDRYQKQMAGLLEQQQSSGLWMQLLGSTDPKNWIETSGSAMFLFAMLTGVQQGWLDESTFLEPAKKGWMGLVSYLQGSKLTKTAAGFWPSTGQPSDYLNASVGQPGDPHGTAAFLWAASAALRLFNPTATVPYVLMRQPVQSTVFLTLPNERMFDLSGRIVQKNGINTGSLHSAPMVIVRKEAASSVLTINQK